MPTLTVVCPVYNEEAVIGEFCHEVLGVLSGIADRWSSQVLFVVDRGTDRTLELLKEIAASHPEVRLIALSARFGQQAALLAGLDHCDSDAVVMMDSDGQHPPSLIPGLIAGFERGFDVVYTVREQGAGVPALKRLSSRLFYRLLAEMSDTAIVDGAADFRLMSRRIVEVFQSRLRERNLFLRGLVPWVGFPSLAVPFTARPRPAGRTKFPLRRMVRLGIDGVVSFTRAPLRAASFLGLVVLGLGATATLVAIAGSILGRSPASFWLWATALLCVLGGTQLLFLGILGEYVGAILDEVKARPHYLVEERINFPREATPVPQLERRGLPRALSG
jgi:polyisoprenyl-phosphate glycosyltransferase